MTDKLRAAAEGAAGTRWRRFRIGSRGLAGRLIVGVTVLALLLVLGVGSATYLALRSFLYSQLDQQLAADVDRHHAGFYFSPHFEYRGSRPGGDGAVWAVAFDAAGHQVAPNPGLATRMSLSSGERARLAADVGDGPTFVTTTAGARLRVQVVQVGAIQSAAGAAPATVAIGLSTGAISTTLRHLLRVELIIGAAAIAIALAATTIGVRASLRRLKRVTKLAWEVSADVSPLSGGLSRRVALDGMDVDTEVGQLAYSVNSLLSAVEMQVAERTRSEQRMREFLLDASHELRTPLTSLRGYAELARMQRRSGDHSTVGDTLDRIEVEGTRMSRLVDDLLALARSDEGAPLHTQYIEADDVIANAVRSVRAAYPEREINVAADPGLVVSADHEQLHRAVVNLVANAAVHTDPRGPIGVSAFRVDGAVVIQVVDHGPGLPPVEAARVFDRFWRADKARTRVRGGNGLGMSIVASIVRQHGGSVRFASTVEAGSTVTIRLPDPSATTPS